MKKLLTSLFACLLCLAAAAQEIKWETSVENLGEGLYRLSLKGAVPEDWHVYSMYTPDGGPMATSIEFSAGEAVGKAKENEPHKEFDSLFEVEVWSFSEVYTITQIVRVKDPAAGKIEGTVDYQLCKEGMCTMHSYDFAVSTDVPVKAKQ